VRACVNIFKPEFFMRIISFSNASAQPFWSASFQSVAPWLAHFRNSLSPIQTVPKVRQDTNTLEQALVPKSGSEGAPPAFRIAGEASLTPCQTLSNASPHSRLRIVREFDSAISSDCAGRMVISGRMADVCAELDRMALRAATVQ
jgi:hypothetical protein